MPGFTIKAIRGLLELEDRWTAKLDAAASRTAGFTTTMEKSLETVGQKMTRGGATLTAAFTVPIAGVAAASLKMANDFEGVMNRVEAAIPDPSDTNLKALRQAAQEWGAATVFSSKEAAEAMVELGKAGLNSNTIIATLPATLDLAVAGQLKLSEAATLSANVMSTYGLRADQMAKANDIMAKAANLSTIDVHDLGETFKYVAPLAQTVGYSLSEVSGAAALLGTAGIKADMAGTALKAMMTALIKPTSRQAEVMKQLGLDTAFSGDKLMSLPQILDQFTKAGGGATEAMTLFGARGGPAFLKLQQMGGPALDDMNQKLEASDGYAKQVADTYMKGLPGALERAKGSLETAGIAIGTVLVPAMIAVANVTEKVANFITNYVVPAFDAIPKPLQVVIGLVVGFAAALGPVIMGIGLMSTGLATVLPLIAPVGAAILAIVTGPIGLLAAGLAAGALAWHTWGDDITGVVVNTYNSVKEWLVDKWEGSIFQSIARLLESIIKLWAALEIKVIQSAMNVAIGVTNWLVDKLKPVYDFIKPFLDGVAKVWTVAKDTIIAIVSAIYTGVKTYLVDKFNDIVASLKGKIDAVTGFFNNMYDKVVGRSYVPDMVDEIGQHFGRLDGNMVKPAQLATQVTSQAFYQLARDIATSLGASMDLAKGFGSLFSGLAGSMSGGLEGLKGFLNVQGTNIAKDFTSTLLSFVPGVGPLLASLGGPIVDGVKKIFNGIFGGADGRGMVEDFVKKSFGSFDNLHNRLLQLGDDGEKLWIQLTQKVGRDDKTAAAAAIKAVENALMGTLSATEDAVSDTSDNLTTQAKGLYANLEKILGQGIKVPAYIEMQGQPGSGGSSTTPTAVPSGATAVSDNPNNRPMIVTMNLDGRTAARKVLPYLADEVELNTA